MPSINVNPIKKNKKKYNIYYLDVKEINKIIDSSKKLRDRVILKILARTGIRRFELCQLKVSDVDFDRKLLYIPAGKGHKPRSVPIDNDTLQDLQFYIQSRRYGKLIQSNNKQSDGIDESRINIIVKKSGIKSMVSHPDPTKKYLNPHIFRHSFIRHLLKKNVPPNMVQQLAGHTDIRTTLQMYGIPSFNDIQERYNEISDTFYEKEKIIQHKPPQDEKKDQNI
jgi:integrase/recombinase XerD